MPCCRGGAHLLVAGLSAASARAISEIRERFLLLSLGRTRATRKLYVDHTSLSRAHNFIVTHEKILLGTNTFIQETSLASLLITLDLYMSIICGLHSTMTFVLWHFFMFASIEHDKIDGS